MVTKAAAPLAFAPDNAAYTRFKLVTDSSSIEIVIHDECGYRVPVITALDGFGTCTLTIVDYMTLAEAREYWAAKRREGYAPSAPFRRDVFGPIPAKAA